jgi:aminopeptidase N
MKMNSGNILTQGDALVRAQMISNVHYEIDLNLHRKDKSYRAATSISFDFMPHKNQMLRIDFISEKIKSILLNGKKIEKPIRNDSRIYIPANLLSQTNILVIQYTSLFDKTGSGFHRFVDPIDHEEYLHTDFEPFDAHRLFPCFDQPDIKATYQLTVQGPQEWQYIHNTTMAKKEMVLSIKESGNKGYIRINFKKTKKFSTYLFALVIGPYEHWTDAAGQIKLGIYCRKSLKKFMDYKNIFDVTRESMAFLEKYFSYPYPYEKYDQVFVPEFNFGAMENVGCVTFSERYIFRHKVLYKDHLNRANTIAHEMVHMWFGNLVTMKWWNDLWLNESFADYLSFYTLGSGKLFSDAMLHFFARKEWACRQDQLSTTHPVATRARDTVEAFSNFDGISYAKGAAILKQLQYFIGETKFRDRLRRYFKKYSENNTTLKDFLEVFSDKDGPDIHSWSRQWLETTGVNTLIPEIKDGKLQITQLAQRKNNIIREHSLEYTGYKLQNGKLNPAESGKLAIKGATCSVPLKNKETVFALLNANDFTYAKVFVSKTDFQLIKSHLLTIKDNFARRIIWGNLWQMVLDNALSPLDFLQLFLDLGFQEKDSSILGSHIASKVISITEIFLTDKNRELWLPRIFALSWQMLSLANENERDPIIWFDLLLRCAEQPSDLALLEKILNQKTKIQGLTIDQEKRWNIIIQLIAFAYPRGHHYLEKEKRNDKSDLGLKKSFQADVAIPDAKGKKMHWYTFSQKQLFSTDYLRYGMEKFHWPHQKKMLMPFVNAYIKALPKIYLNRDIHFANAFGIYLFPSWFRSREFHAKLQKVLQNREKYPSPLIKLLKEQKDNLERILPILKKQD